jgi:hypothetical protein
MRKCSAFCRKALENRPDLYTFQSMRWMRRARTRRLTAGMALAATILHVAFLSLHLVMSASLAFAGDALAGQNMRFSFVICTPPRRIVTSEADGATPLSNTSGDTDTSTATFCPICAGTTSPALILPQLPPLPVYRARDGATVPVTATPAEPGPRHEVAAIQSRAPPALI